MSGGAETSVIRRAVDSTAGHTRAAEPGTVSAADLAARVTSGYSPPVIQRGNGAANVIRRSSISASSPDIVRRTLGDEGQSDFSSAQPVIDPAEFEKLLRSNFDLIVELLEDRILSQLERRGGRYRDDF
jgi:hypothetical protein